MAMGLLSTGNRRQKKKKGNGRTEVKSEFKTTKQTQNTKNPALLKTVHESYLSTEIFYRRNQIFIGKDGYYFNSGKTL